MQTIDISLGPGANGELLGEYGLGDSSGGQDAP